MNNSQIAYIAIMCGAAVIALFGIALNMISRPKDRPPEFDERQKIVQGKANGYAYATLLVSLGAYLLYDLIAEKPVMEAGIAVTLCIIVSAMVHSFTCIIKESYVPLSNQGKGHPVLDLFIGVVWVAQGVMRIIDGSIIKDGVLQFPVLIFALGVAYIMQGGLLMICNAIQKKETAKESGEAE